MFNDLTPVYLSSLVPPLVQNASSYNLRNSNDTQTVAIRTTLFYNSFLPSSIRDWNRLNPDIRNAGTPDAFKFKLNQKLPVIPKHYYSGIWKNLIWHTRIRTGCSSLKNDLFLKNIIDSPLCTCNSGEVENAYHFFLCPQRNFGRHIVIALSVRPCVCSSVPLRVRCISPIFFEVGIPNLVCGCILG